MTTDSSVTFSLDQILEIEKQRIREEQEAVRLREAAELARREAAAIAARAAQEAAILAEEQRRAREAAQRAETEARFRAIQAAIVEAARVEAAQKGLLEQRSHEQEHERRLAEIAQDTSKRRLKRALIAGLVSAGVLLGGGAGLYFGELKPEADRVVAEKMAAVEAERAKAKAAQDSLDASNRRYSALQAEFDVAKTEMERRAIAQKMAEIKPASQALPGPARIAQPPPKPCVDDNDPLNPCLKR
jgi:colicin import membrane protein